MRFSLYLLAASLALLPLAGAALAQSSDCSVVGISADEAPPPLPDYDQPPVPGPGYLWTPGYWAWNNVDYYWVPGTWVDPPQPDVYWTPPYWAFVGGGYVFYRGYWGPHVGYYGGVNYGYGYGGDGYEGGRWDRGAFYYNRSVTNINGVQINNVYDKTVVINNNSHVSYNGGRGGLRVRPTAAQEEIAREPHIAPTHIQTAHLRAASLNSGGFASSNHGRPAIAATSRAGQFRGPGVTGAGTSHRFEHENGMNAPTNGAEPNTMTHHEGMGGPGAEPGVHHELRSAPAATGAAVHEGLPGAARRPHEHGAETTHVMPHEPTRMPVHVEPMHRPPPTHQEHMTAPRAPMHEMHREPPPGGGMHMGGGGMPHAAPMHMGGGGGGGHPPGGGGRPSGGGGHPPGEHQH